MPDTPPPAEESRPDDHQEWPARLTRAIAREITRHRKARGMSVRELSEEIEKLGLVIQRPVLSNLENGRRGVISVAELLVIAAALDVPALQLLAPTGYVDEVGILPGRDVTPLAAARWVNGWYRLPGDERDDERFFYWVPLFEDHDNVLYDLRQSQRHPSNTEREIQRAEDLLVRIRDSIRDTGRTPPPLPADVGDVEARVEERRRRKTSPRATRREARGVDQQDHHHREEEGADG